MPQDLRFGLKLLWKEKAFSFTALLTLALCIGANTAIFTVLRSVLLDPLPYPNSGRLVTLYNIYPGVGVTEYGANSVPDYLDRRKLTGVFDSVALTSKEGFDTGPEGSPVRIDGESVTPSYFRVLRVSPVLGRPFLEEDGVLGKEKVAILSHGLWKDLYGEDRGVLGRDIRLGGVPYRIVGVMPEDFRSLDPKSRIWIPLAFTPKQMSDESRHSNSWGMIARLRPGVTLRAAQQRIDSLNRLNLDRFPKYRELLKSAHFSTVVIGAKDQLVKDVRPMLYLLQAAVLLVLLIGCVNVANLMLVRSNVRMKELAIRFSLGAGRWRLGRQLLTESVTLALLGGLAGIGVGYAGVNLLTILGASELPRGAGIRIDSKVLLFSIALAALTGIAFGSVPVFHLMRRDLNEVFRQNGRTGTSEKRALWTRSTLVVAQISLAFVLLIASGLLTVSFQQLLTVDPGFRTQDVLSAHISLPKSRYADDLQTRGFLGRLLADLRTLPGVAHVGFNSYLPFGGDMNASVITIPGYNAAPGENPPVPGWNVIGGDYFQAMGVPLLEGRTFSEADTDKAPPVAIIDQFLARKYWPRGGAVGSHIRRGLEPTNPICTVVGVVGTVKEGDLSEQKTVGQIYFPYGQLADGSVYLVAKTQTGSAEIVSGIRRRLRQADPELPLFDVKTMQARLSDSLLNRRAAMIICLAFAGLALVLSAIGIYGVLAYAVTQRVREFGIRAALGAEVRDVLGMVLGHGLKLAALGLAIGVAGALALTRLMESLLFGVKADDPLVYVVVGLLLAAVALAASLAPSVRAVRIQPAVALRQE
ncbi:MAG TPA: ABC transporter permease [Bryobacteraceae bacterium]|nr:ABC transporter permease [Bryobacteraceae bacterium]